MNIWQVKLSTSEEILCEIVGTKEEDFLILNPLKIVEIPSFSEDDTNAFYILRPWFSFMGGFNEKEIILSAKNVLAKYQPNDSVVRHYVNSVTEVIEFNNKDVMTPEELVENFYKEKSELDSSAPSNVISFPKF